MATGGTFAESDAIRDAAFALVIEEKPLVTWASTRVWCRL